jgi:DNA-directed RNA polymerase sigma subunit (sigma70/sigma32)
MQVAGFKSDEYEMSLPEIGKELGLSTSRVYELQVSAMFKVRKYCATHDIKFEDLVDSLSAKGRGR